MIELCAVSQPFFQALCAEFECMKRAVEMIFNCFDYHSLVLLLTVQLCPRDSQYTAPHGQ